MKVVEFVPTTTGFTVTFDDGSVGVAAVEVTGVNTIKFIGLTADQNVAVGLNSDGTIK
jgi:hypothetical protein